jgi:hypothetical protein
VKKGQHFSPAAALFPEYFLPREITPRLMKL